MNRFTGQSTKFLSTFQRLLEKLLNKIQLPSDMNPKTASGRNLTMLVINVVNSLCQKHVGGFLHPLRSIINEPKYIKVCTPIFNSLGFNALHSNLLNMSLLTTLSHRKVHSTPWYNVSKDFWKVCHALSRIDGWLQTTPICFNQVLLIISHYYSLQTWLIPSMPGDNKGYIKPKSSHLLLSTCSVEPRHLSPLSCAVLSCIVHIALYSALLLDQSQVSFKHRMS